VTELTITGARAMSPADLVAFTLLTIAVLEKKFNPNQARGADGKFISEGGSHEEGGGGEHGGGGEEEESGGGGHGGGHVSSHTSSGGHEGGGGGGGVEPGSLLVGNKDNVGETVNHPVHGDGTITAVDQKAGTATIQFGDGTTHTFAQSTANQKAKLIQTGTEQGKTHIANVKVLKDGSVVNRDNGKKIGNVGQADDGKWTYSHSQTGEVKLGHSSKHTAVKALVEHNNEHAGKLKPTEEAKPEEAAKPAEEAKAPEWAKAGHVDPNNLVGTHLAANGDVKSGGVKIGEVKPNASGGYDVYHADGTKLGTTNGNVAGMKSIIINAHNEKIDALSAGEAKPAEAPKPEAEAPKSPDYKSTGDIYDEDLSTHPDGTITHDDTGIKIGEVVPDGTGYGYQATHADGTKLPPEPTHSDSLLSLEAYHNQTYGLDAKPAEAPKPEETGGEKTYETSGEIEASNLSTKNHTYDAAGNVTADIVNNADGMKIGTIAENNHGTYDIHHADGTSLGAASSLTAGKASLTAYHNSKYGTPKTETTESKPEAEAPKPTAPAPSYHKAGTSVEASDITVKKDGTAIHKPTGEVIGTVEKNGYGGWKASHAGGPVDISNEYTKKEAVQRLANAHNAKVAVESTVKPNESTEWSKDATPNAYGHMTTEDGSSPYSKPDVTVKDQDEKTMGTIHSVGNVHTITHVSGAKYTFIGQKYEAQGSLAQAHNKAVKIAEGKAPEPTKPAEDSAEVKSYKAVGNVNSSSIKSGNVQKDVDGKVTGSDMLASDGTKIGYTKANADGTMDVYHADGTKVGENIKPGTGQATSKLGEYQTKKYGTPAPKPTISSTGSAYASSHSTSGSVPPPGADEAPKFEHNDASEEPGGMYNDPESAYSAPTAHQISSGFSSSSVAGGMDTLYEQPKSTTLGLTAPERAALKSYTGSGANVMNHALRDNESNEYLNKQINHLDNAFLKAPATEKTTTVYRCMKPSVASKVFTSTPGAKVGKTVLDKGYGSTGAVPQWQFGEVVMRITSPAGTRYLRPDGGGQYGDNEAELLLPRGMHYKVMRDEVVNGQRQIDAVIVNGAQY